MEAEKIEQKRKIRKKFLQPENSVQMPGWRK